MELWFYCFWYIECVVICVYFDIYIELFMFVEIIFYEGSLGCCIVDKVCLIDGSFGGIESFCGYEIECVVLIDSWYFC